LEPNVAASPFDAGVQLAGRFALGRHGSSAGETRRVPSAAAPYLRSGEPVAGRVEQVGLRPVTPDGLPLIGQVTGKPGVLVATGHGMLGLTLAPVPQPRSPGRRRPGAFSGNALLFSVKRLTRRHR
jgi:D-amino-acid dehydrogenase